MNDGGASEITSIDNPKSEGAAFEPATKKWVASNFPDALTEEPGHRHWRRSIHALNQAGFDVLVTDRRGNGVSGGVSGYNTGEQANDIFRELTELESGDGLRLLTLAGEVLSGSQAGGRLLAGQKTREIPIMIGSYSRGSYATAWTMRKNFVEDCNFDLSDGGCKLARGWSNIKGAILYGPNSAGLGDRMSEHDPIEAALRSDNNPTYYPDGNVLAIIGRWPGVPIVKGIWDYLEGLEGSLDAFNRASEPKDIFVFHGPHQLKTQAPENMKLVGDRMAAFAKAAVLGRKQIEGSLRGQLEGACGIEPGPLGNHDGTKRMMPMLLPRCGSIDSVSSMTHSRRIDGPRYREQDYAFPWEAPMFEQAVQISEAFQQGASQMQGLLIPALKGCLHCRSV